VGTETLYFDPARHFGVEGKGHWFWDYDEANRRRKFGCGRWEFWFFIQIMASEYAEQLRFLALSAQAVRYNPNLLKSISQFRRLERFTLFYSSTDVDARRQWVDD